MKLSERFFVLITIIALTVSLGLGLFVIVDNVQAAPIRPAAMAMLSDTGS